MSQAGGPSSGKRIVPAKMNIYTVLAAVATLVLLVGVGFVWNYSKQLTGQDNPWHVEPKTSDQQSVRAPE